MLSTRADPGRRPSWLIRLGVVPLHGAKRHPLMVDRNLLRELDVPDPEGEEFDMGLLLSDGPGVRAGGIVPGKVVEVVGDQVVVDVGYKSEGLVRLSEWEEGEAPPGPGDEVQLLPKGRDADPAEFVLPRHKARRIRAWDRFTSGHREG